MKSILITLIILGALGGGGYYWWQHQEKLRAAVVPIPTVTVKRGAIKQSVSATGRIVANLDVDIKSKASGTVVKLPYDISQPVKKGALLMELDPIDEQRNVDLAQVALTSSTAKLATAKENLTMGKQKLSTDHMRADASVKAAEAKLQRTQQRYDRLKSAVAANAVTAEDVDSAQNDVVQAQSDLMLSKAQTEELKQTEQLLEVRQQDINLAQATVRSDEISLDNAKQRLTDTKIMAPIDGVVAAQTVQIGTIISSGISNVGGGTTVLTLSDLSQLFALASVDESDIGNVSIDQAVIITADAFPGKKLKGKVSRIATRGVNVSNVVTFEVKIEIVDEKKRLLKPEMTTNLEIVAAEKPDALLVPSDTITRKKGQRLVTVQKPDGSTEERPVTVGITDGANVEIVEGLQENELIQQRKNEADSRWRDSKGGQQGGQRGGMGGALGGMGGGGGGKAR